MNIDTKQYNEIISNNLRNIRESRKIHPDKFANKIGISGRILRYIEEGKHDANDFIDIICLIRIQHEFGKAAISELFEGIK
jgi:hypothetical protein